LLEQPDDLRNPVIVRLLSVYVRQTPGLAAAQLGESVSFQCLMISKDEENNITCPGNQDVHWFRTASGTSQPGVIFTPTDLNNQTAGKSCFYHFTKTLNDSSDAGIYYCALAMCGEILFGNGTRVETKNNSQLWSLHNTKEVGAIPYILF
uniref:Ig-like domain-containing protein n=1 Tax=Oryzias melastigma TaxID=30732 RepID=A0A3B3BMV4_ORYME